MIDRENREGRFNLLLEGRPGRDSLASPIFPISQFQASPPLHIPIRTISTVGRPRETNLVFPFTFLISCCPFYVPELVMDVFFSHCQTENLRKSNNREKS